MSRYPEISLSSSGLNTGSWRLRFFYPYSLVLTRPHCPSELGDHQPYELCSFLFFPFIRNRIAGLCMSCLPESGDRVQFLTDRIAEQVRLTPYRQSQITFLIDCRHQLINKFVFRAE